MTGLAIVNMIKPSRASVYLAIHGETGSSTMTQFIELARLVVARRPSISSEFPGLGRRILTAHRTASQWPRERRLTAYTRFQTALVPSSSQSGEARYPEVSIPRNERSIVPIPQTLFVTLADTPKP